LIRQKSGRQDQLVGARAIGDALRRPLRAAARSGDRHRSLDRRHIGDGLREIDAIVWNEHRQYMRSVSPSRSHQLILRQLSDDAVARNPQLSAAACEQNDAGAGFGGPDQHGVDAANRYALLRKTSGETGRCANCNNQENREEPVRAFYHGCYPERLKSARISKARDFPPS
jgi:hypothetical protein